MDSHFDMVLEDEFDALCVDVDSSKAKFPGKLHARKVAKELNVDSGLIYLPGQPELLLEDSDQPRLFRQRRYFFYMCGADFADCAVTYDVARDRLILWIPFVEPRQILWFGRKPTAAECQRRLDVDDVRYVAQLPKYLRHTACSSQAPVTYVLHDSQAPDVAVRKLDASTLQPAMDRARSVKTDYEVSMIRRANAISSAAHRRVAQYIRRMSSERHVEALIQAVCTAQGARSQAYPIIAGSGENGSVLHYGANDQPLAGRQSIVIDAGCEWNCYASDVTRTMPLTGAWSAKGAAVHAVVQRMQERCIAALKPGVAFTNVHLLAASIGIDGLLDLGILKGSKDDIAKAGTVAAFFPHSIGHHVGLDVHDNSGARVKRASVEDLEHGKRAVVSPAVMSELVRTRFAPDARLLEPNMVLTVEPGIYFNREYLEGYFKDDPTHSRYIDWDLVEEYYPVGGVRIEDCILVTSTGHENLTGAPKGDELLDIINGRRH